MTEVSDSFVSDCLAMRGACSCSAEELARRYGEAVAPGDGRFRVEEMVPPDPRACFLLDSKTEEWGVYERSTDGSAFAPLLPRDFETERAGGPMDSKTEGEGVAD